MKNNVQHVFSNTIFIGFPSDSDGMKFETELKNYKKIRDQIEQIYIYIYSTLLCEEDHCIEKACVVSLILLESSR